MNQLLQGKVCIVTGAARGIGRSIAEQFLQEGAVVYAMDCRKEDLVWTSEATLPIHAITIDICDFTLVKQTILTIKKEHGHIDVVVNNAGIVTYEMLSLIDFEKFRKMIDVNVIALIHILQIASRIMIKQHSGSIINMASMVGEQGAVGQLSYSATKGAVASATKSAAKELAEHNVRVNAIAPGMVATERLKNVISNSFAGKVDDIRIGRMAEPADIANLALFLASDSASYITGQIIGIDGAIKL